ncbi:hypothetical protein FGF1_35730 [Flavobacteriaceae bacterium GF1]
MTAWWVIFEDGFGVTFSRHSALDAESIIVAMRVDSYFPFDFIQGNKQGWQLIGLKWGRTVSLSKGLKAMIIKSP